MDETRCCPRCGHTNFDVTVAITGQLKGTSKYKCTHCTTISHVGPIFRNTDLRLTNIKSFRYNISQYVLNHLTTRPDAEIQRFTEAIREEIKNELSFDNYDLVDGLRNAQFENRKIKEYIRNLITWEDVDLVKRIDSKFANIEVIFATSGSLCDKSYDNWQNNDMIHLLESSISKDVEYIYFHHALKSPGKELYKYGLIEKEMMTMDLSKVNNDSD